MSADNLSHEKSQSTLSANVAFPGYPDLPPPYSSQVPQVPSAPSAPQKPSTDKNGEPNSSVKKETDDNVIRPIEFKPVSMRLTCPSCKAEVMTRTEKYPTLRTHACACILFWIVWWPCICLPYCLPGCNDVDHFCPNCDSHIGGYKC